MFKNPVLPVGFDKLRKLRFVWEADRALGPCHCCQPLCKFPTSFQVCRFLGLFSVHLDHDNGIIAIWWVHWHGCLVCRSLDVSNNKVGGALPPLLGSLLNLE